MLRFAGGLVACLCALTSATAYGSDVSDYKESWEYKALALQSKIDLYAPLGEASFVTTHNSFNAGVYSRNGSYADPNQKLSLYDQLEIGVRAVELDVHYTFSSSGLWPWQWKFGQKLKLSHGRGDWGTHPNDRLLSEGLAEIRSWLNQNPDEVVIVYMEDQLEGRYDKAISELDRHVGDLVYKPSGCQSLPMDLTKAEVLDAGKQLLLIGGNCATSAWANTVFYGHFSSTEDLDRFEPYPECRVGDRGADYLQTHLVRVYEDSTRLSAFFGDPGPRISAGDAAEMTQCGIGAIGLDQVVPFDARLRAQIWSWGQNEPNNVGGEDCAVQRGDGRFNDISCNRLRHVACRDPETRAWYITAGTYRWAEATGAVEEEFPGQELVFDVPKSGYENAQLHGLKRTLGISEVWLNYSDRDVEGQWRPGR